MRTEYGYDVLIVGTGVAGLNCALHLPGSLKAVLLCKDTPDKSDSYLAQGGICRLQGKEDFGDYFNDTMRAGHGENNPEAVECMINHSEEITDELVALGADFARNPDGTLAVTREGGHSRNRICFHEDCTGKEITSTLLKRVEELKNVKILAKTTMLDIIEGEEGCAGAVVMDNASGEVYAVCADYTVLACGGIGGVFTHSTNFRLLTGDGIAVCINHGVAIDNINYVQIHPTTLYTENESGRSFLISESVRGEGAVLLDKHFKRFCDELQPRDVVTAAIYKKMEEDGTPYVWLDMRGIPAEEIRAHFPSIAEKCAEEGYDVFKECIPVVPAQHYFMGGIRSDLYGRTTMKRLYAVGETCCNGVHGANRLASNSLLESLLFSKRAAEDIAKGYERYPAQVSQKACGALDESKYADPDKLLQSYKQIVKNAIKEAERVKPHFGRT